MDNSSPNHLRKQLHTLTRVISGNKALFMTVALTVFVIGFCLALYKANHPTAHFQQWLRPAAYVKQGTTTPVNDIDDTLNRMKVKYIPKAFKNLRQQRPTTDLIHKQVNIENNHKNNLLAFHIYAGAHDKQEIEKLLNIIKRQLNEAEKPIIDHFKELKTAKLNDIRQLIQTRHRLDKILKTKKQNANHLQQSPPLSELILASGFTQSAKPGDIYDIKYDTERELNTIASSRFIGQLKVRRVSWSFWTILGISSVLAILTALLTVIIKSYLSDQL